MRIKKKNTSVGILGKILSIFSNSQENTYSCDYINKLNKPKIIYETTETDCKTTINLIDDVSDYSYIDIEYGMVNYGNGISTMRVYNPDGKKIRIDGIWSGNSPVKVYAVHSEWDISGNAISLNNAGQTHAINNNESYGCGSAQVYISKVIAYK